MIQFTVQRQSSKIYFYTIRVVIGLAVLDNAGAHLGEEGDTSPALKRKSVFEQARRPIGPENAP